MSPELGPQLELVGRVCRRLSERLLAALDAALGGGHQLLTSCHRRQLQPGGWSVLRLLHYPPVPEDAGDRQLTRCGTHTDFSTLTLLFQHGVGGLEVRPDTGKRMEATLLLPSAGGKRNPLHHALCQMYVNVMYIASMGSNLVL